MTYKRSQLMLLCDDFQRAILCIMIAKARGNPTRVAAKLNTPRGTFQNLLIRLGLSTGQVMARQGVAKRGDIDWYKEAARYGAKSRAALILPEKPRLKIDLVRETCAGRSGLHS